jgi:hypothetical protein
VPIFSAVIASRTGNPTEALPKRGGRIAAGICDPTHSPADICEEFDADFPPRYADIGTPLASPAENTALRPRLNHDLVRQGDSNGLRLSD